MTAEQQLERSVLEGKERDELHAIAQALSVKTTTRTKKADIIDGILKATGVAVDDGSAGNGDTPGGTSNGSASEAPPRRRRRPGGLEAQPGPTAQLRPCHRYARSHQHR